MRLTFILNLATYSVVNPTLNFRESAKYPQKFCATHLLEHSLPYTATLLVALQVHASLCSISVAFPNLYRYYWLVILRSWGISFKYIFVFYRCCRLMSTLGTMPAGHQRGILHHTHKYLACHLRISLSSVHGYA